MKQFFIIFSLCFGAIPSYIFTSPVGKKTWGKNDPDDKDKKIDGEVPALFDMGIHAIAVEEKPVADSIKLIIEKYSEKGYGEIDLEIVEDLKESSIWNGGVIPTPTKKAKIDFSYIDPTLPLQIPTPSVTKAGDLNCAIGKTPIELVVALHSQLATILAELSDKINTVEGYTATLVDNSIIITSTEDAPAFTWAIKTEAENLIYPSETIFNGEKSLALEFAYADELAPTPLTIPSTTSAGSLVYKIGDTSQSVEVILNDVIADITSKLKTNIDLVTGYTAKLIDNSIIITSTEDAPTFTWILDPVTTKVSKKSVSTVSPDNLEFTKEVIFTEA